MEKKERKWNVPFQSPSLPPKNHLEQEKNDEEQEEEERLFTFKIIIIN